MAYGQHLGGGITTDAPPNHPPPQPSVPDIPGQQADEQTSRFLREHVGTLTGAFGNRFPGAQPVSFTKSTLDLLLREDFWVCEKSDGQRVLVLIVVPGGGQQQVFLIDRKNRYFLQPPGIFFPHSDQMYYTKPHHTPQQKAAVKERVAADGLPYHNGWPGRRDTLLDGELVWDTEKTTGRRRLRLLLFDALVVDGACMSARPLTKRYGRLHSMIYKPFAEYMRQNPASVGAAPFELKIKNMDLAYGIDAVLKRMPHLEHGNDGLIFTGMHSGYTFGTDDKIIKWKPPHENSIDFMLRLHFPPDARVANGSVPDLRAKPLFLLEEYMGDERGRGREARYESFDWAWVEDDEWEDMKQSGIQFDDRIVECVWDPHGGPSLGEVPIEEDPRGSPHRPPAWRIHRIRDDKKDGNHHTIVEKIMHSIQDGVEEAQVVEAAAKIRAAWKSDAREAKRKAIDSGQQAVSAAGVNGGDAGGHSSSTGGPPRPLPVGPVGVFRL